MSRPRIPGPLGWIRGHWRGELSLFRTLLVGPLVGFAFLLGFSAIGWSAVERVPHYVELIWLWEWALKLAWLLGFGWWTWGTLRKAHRLGLAGHALGMSSCVVAGLLGLYTTAWVAEEIAISPPELSLAQAFKIGPCTRRAMDRYANPWKVEVSPAADRVVATGPISQGSEATLRAVLDQHPQIRLLELNSPGGLVDESALIKVLVQERGLNTLVLQRCASACTDVFLAGERRYVGPEARFGFHRSGVCGQEPNAPWSEIDIEARDYFKARGVEAEFVRQAFDTPHEEVWRPSLEEVMAAGFGTDWLDR